MKTSQKRYRAFVEAGAENSLLYPLNKIVGQAVLGSKKFVKKVVDGLGEDKGLEEVTAKRIFSNKIDINELYRRVCEYYKRNKNSLIFTKISFLPQRSQRKNLKNMFTILRGTLWLSAVFGLRVNRQSYFIVI